MFKSSFLVIFFSFSFSATVLPDGFVDLQKIIPDIVVDLRYFSKDNFVGERIDGYESKKCVISIDAALALSAIQKALKSQGYGLKIFDAYRPQQAVNHFVRWAKNIEDTKMKSIYYPEVEKKVLFEEGYISARSGHTRGSTVDLTIIYLSGNKKGQEVDMGTHWDFFSPRSWPSSDDVDSSQKSNRLFLQKIMSDHGFRPYQEEWWHFTLRNEPFPETYFDFPIK
jgi:D-alanyl-D-alanine dipeptidase